MAIKRITHVEAFHMTNEELINKAQDLAYQVGEITSDAECLDYAASMSSLLIEIKMRAIAKVFEINTPTGRS